ncbi:hypothetical protein DdX_18657 [Ditylenchus destructor]|uniref:Uncharacterized protein n=1 Tax=Ditylenchus destructor TaxID=166010 RepID=A0AAD4MKB4_9BILA|nr:hypothetical protein DdX_18657 [Ditylenchus destructor]
MTSCDKFSIQNTLKIPRTRQPSFGWRRHQRTDFKEHLPCFRKVGAVPERGRRARTLQFLGQTGSRVSFLAGWDPWAIAGFNQRGWALAVCWPDGHGSQTHCREREKREIVGPTMAWLVMASMSLKQFSLLFFSTRLFSFYAVSLPGLCAPSQTEKVTGKVGRGGVLLGRGLVPGFQGSGQK